MFTYYLLVIPVLNHQASSTDFFQFKIENFVKVILIAPYIKFVELKDIAKKV